jgi:DNA-directed RNA polymerase specialized sigma24 family protein
MSPRAGNTRIRRRLISALAQLPERHRATYVAIARDELGYEALDRRFGVGVDEIERDLADALAMPWWQRLVRWIGWKGSK